MRVGIVGCGTAGPAAALLLADLGHEVEILERFERPEPVGAGILLQPTGMAVLSALGLLESVRARGSRGGSASLTRRGTFPAPPTRHDRG